MSRTADIQRTTKETDVRVQLDLDGTGGADIATGVGFYDHMLEALAHHGLFDLTIATTGDLEVDEHHTVEDTALVLGEAFAAALGDRAGIQRYGDATVPMDESCARVVVDVGGRPYTVIDIPFTTERIGSLGTQLIPHALEALARRGGFTLHVTAAGRNDHHLAEAVFKALARALRDAVAADPRREGVPSTKGTT
jgi:imidazoleglycerol-phosphate dehydratase